MPKLTVRTFAVICVAATSAYVMWLGNKIIDTLSGPGWCATAFGAGKQTATDGTIKGLDACVSLLTIQLRSLATNSHILLGTIALCLGVLNVIVIAGAKFSGSVDEHGAHVDLDKSGAMPVQVVNDQDEPVPVAAAPSKNPSP